MTKPARRAASLVLSLLIAGGNVGWAAGNVRPVEVGVAPNFDGAGRIAPTAGLPGVLDGERIVLSPTVVQQVGAIDTALTTAVSQAAATVFGAEGIQVQARGSTTRQTYVDENPDHDISVALPPTWGDGDFAGALRET